MFDPEVENVLVQVPLLDDDKLYPKEQALVDRAAQERQRVALRDESAHRGGHRHPGGAQPARDRRGFTRRAEAATVGCYLAIRPHSRMRLNG